MLGNKNDTRIPSSLFHKEYYCSYAKVKLRADNSVTTDLSTRTITTVVILEDILIKISSKGPE